MKLVDDFPKFVPINRRSSFRIIWPLIKREAIITEDLRGKLHRSSDWHLEVSICQ